jgi:thymidylate synthase
MEYTKDKIVNCVDVNDLLYKSVDIVTQYGTKITVRNAGTKEVLFPHFIIARPEARTLLYPQRGNNPFSTLFETIWVLASKDNNIETLSKFLPRAKDYSDDGKTWRAGYPERIRAFGAKKTNQLNYVYEKLKADPNTRQAIMSLWSPEEDCFDENGELKESSDFPCSNHLQFLIRGGKLHCSFCIRSNDAIFGLSSINFYEFTVIQEILASSLSVELGEFHYNVGSLQVYDWHKEKAEKILKYVRQVYTPSLNNPYKISLSGIVTKTNKHTINTLMIDTQRFAETGISYYTLMAYYNYVLYYIKRIVGNLESDVIVPFNQQLKLIKMYAIHLDLPEYITNMIEILVMYLYYIDGLISFDEIVRCMRKMKKTDLLCSCLYWYMKKEKVIKPDEYNLNKIFEIIGVLNGL